MAAELAELDNFFREACTNARPANIDQIDPQAAVIYPIILPHQLAVIVALLNQPLRYHKTQLSQAAVDRLLTAIRQTLRTTAFLEDQLPAAQACETELVASGVKPLVFVPNGLLRSVPTAETAIAMTFLVINLEQLLWQLLFVFFAVVLPQKVFSSTDGSGCGAILNSPWQLLKF